MRIFHHASQQLFPLRRVSVVATIRPFAAHASITQFFRNDETTPIEEQAAIYGFIDRISDRSMHLVFFMESDLLMMSVALERPLEQSRKYQRSASCIIQKIEKIFYKKKDENKI